MNLFPAKIKRQKHNWARTGTIVACICLLLIGTTVVLAASGRGTSLIEFFTSRTEPGSDLSESGFDLSVSIEKTPANALDGNIHEAGNIIAKQLKEQQPLDSRFAGHWQAEFTSQDEACTYIGFDALQGINWDIEATSTVLNVLGDDKGEILSINLETDYELGDIRLQQFSQVYTEHYDEEVIIGSRTTERIEFTESLYTTENNRQYHIIKASALESGYMCIDAYLVDNGVLHSLHIIYLEKDYEQAEELLHRWVNLI